MSKTISVKLGNDIFEAAEEIIKEQLQQKSIIVAKNSLSVLRDFEILEGKKTGYNT